MLGAHAACCVNSTGSPPEIEIFLILGGTESVASD
jgi:hypothetical protein